MIAPRAGLGKGERGQLFSTLLPACGKPKTENRGGVAAAVHSATPAPSPLLFFAARVVFFVLFFHALFLAPHRSAVLED